MVDVRVKDLSTMKTNTSRSLLRRLKESFIVSTNRKTVDLNRAAPASYYIFILLSQLLCKSIICQFINHINLSHRFISM